MGLTWDEFLNLAIIITNLYHSISYFDDKKIEIKEKNRRVAEAAMNYKELYSNFKYLQFMGELRISLTKILLFSYLKITMIKRRKNIFNY